MHSVLRLTIAAVVLASVAAANDWTQWGGPSRDFQIQASGLADTWPTDGPPKLWERDLGAGYSAILADQGQLYTMYRDGDNDVVIALDAKSGKTLWETRYETGTVEGQVLQFGTGPNTTPLLLDDRLITVSFVGKVNCLSRKDGKILWSFDLAADYGYKPQKFGYSASPMLYKGNVLLLAGGTKHGLIAVNPKDGKLAWGSEPHDISYASPVLIDLDGKDQLIVMTSDEAIGVDPDGGKVAWRHTCVNRYRNNATDPIWSPKDKLLWVATQLDGGARALRLKRNGDKTEVEEAWFERNVRVFHWNVVLVDGFIYGSIGGQTTMLSAVDLKTGEVKWKERGFHKALPIYADGKMILLDENGILALAKVSPEKCEIVSQVQMTGKVSWTTPTLIGTTLYVRDTNKIIALNVGPASAS